MSPKTSASLMLLGLLFDCILFSNTSKFFIMPSSNTNCPKRPCYTLSQLTENTSQYFTSNTTAVFPPGYHKISTEGQLVIQNVSNIFLVGGNRNSLTMIHCTEHFGLAFINITNLTIAELYFSMCGIPLSYTALQLSNHLAISFHIYDYPHVAFIDYLKSSSVTLYLAHITNCFIKKLQVQGSKGVGLLGVNIFGVSFLQNVSVIVWPFVAIEVSFVRNHAQQFGGAVYARDSQIFMKRGGNLSLVENVGYDGGALAMFDGSVITFEVQSQIMFLNNHALHYGGAIYYADDYRTDLHLFPTVLEKQHDCAYRLVISAVPRNNLSSIFEFTLAHTAAEFYNNTAGSSGAAIYGGWVDLCKFYIHYNRETSHAYSFFVTSRKLQFLIICFNSISTNNNYP